MDTPISLSRLHFPVTTLGPGRRIGIWFQGCSIRCAGCISADTWGFRKSNITVADVVGKLEQWLEEADGVTISGGEPFDQIDALTSLLNQIRQKTDRDVLLFTGYAREVVGGQLSKLDGLVDALVSDPYIMDEPPLRDLRGSDNQRLWCLTERARERFAQYDEPIEQRTSSLDVSFDENGQVWFAGIPKPGDFQNLKSMLEAVGHQVQTTEDTSWRRRK